MRTRGFGPCSDRRRRDPWGWCGPLARRSEISPVIELWNRKINTFITVSNSNSWSATPVCYTYNTPCSLEREISIKESSDPRKQPRPFKAHVFVLQNIKILYKQMLFRYKLKLNCSLNMARRKFSISMQRIHLGEATDADESRGRWRIRQQPQRRLLPVQPTGKNSSVSLNTARFTDFNLVVECDVEHLFSTLLQ